MRYLMLSFLLMCMGFQCYEGFQYDGDERYVIKGKVLDDNQKPISNIKVDILDLSDFEYGQSVLRSTTTDNNGDFEIIIANGNTKEFIVTTNSTWANYQYDSQSININFGETYVAIDISTIQDFKYTLSKPIVIGERSEVKFDCSNTMVIGNQIQFYQEVMDDFRMTTYERTLYCDNRHVISFPRNKWLKYTYSTGILGSLNIFQDSIFVDQAVITIKL